MKRIQVKGVSAPCNFAGSPTLLDVILENKIEIKHNCGAMGSCTTCRVLIIQGLDKLNPRTDVESAHAQRRGFPKNLRLSCQTKAVDGVALEIPVSEIDEI